MDEEMPYGEMPKMPGAPSGTKRSFGSMLNEAHPFPKPKMMGQKKLHKGTWDKMRDYASEAEATSYKPPHKRKSY